MALPLAFRAFKFKIDSKSIREKKDSSGNFAYFEGYGSVFDNVDSYDDIIRRGAFTRTLQNLKASGSKLPMLWQHNPYEPIGAFVDFNEDAHGLKVSGELNLDTMRGRETYALLKQGAIRGLSIGYQAVKWSMEEEKRVLEELKLWEISVVTFPANELAFVDAVKGLGMAKKAMEVQSVLCSRDKFDTAEAAASWCEDHGFKHGDVDTTDKFYRFRQFEPTECTEGSDRTIEITDGVKAVVCKRTKAALLAEVKRLVDLLQASADGHACGIKTDAPAEGHASEGEEGTAPPAGEPAPDAKGLESFLQMMKEVNQDAAEELKSIQDAYQKTTKE